jgi:1-acyl-sn-glycerol-3-phosphate acyltransferase
VAKALNDGHTVALFPEGMLTRNGGMNTFLAGYEHIFMYLLVEGISIPVLILCLSSL